MSRTPPPGAIDYEAACALLGLPCEADPNDIDDDQLKKAFRKAALTAHPDKGGSDDAFRQVKAASECIVRAKKHGITQAANTTLDEGEEDTNFEAFFDEEGDDIMAEIILRMYEMEAGKGASGSKRRKIQDLVQRLRRSEATKRAQAEKLARVALAKAQKAKEEQRFWARQEAAGSTSLQGGGAGCYLQWDPRALQRELQKRRLKPPRPATTKTLAEELLRDDERAAQVHAAVETRLVSPGSAAPPSTKKAVFQRPRDKLRDNRKRRAKEIMRTQAAERVERERVEALYVGAGVSLLALALVVFCLDFLFYVGFMRCFAPLACVFGGYFYYSLAAEPAS